MNKYVKEYLHRGLIFGGFGPIIASIVYFILSLTLENIHITGNQMLVITLSTYLLAFVHAGSSVFNTIEHWPIAKSLLFHLGSLYIVYSLCYIINSWIPFDAKVLLIFTLIFLVVYFIIYLTVYLIVRSTSKKINERIK
ncbi:MAG: DUF3021 domain-containing protein [Ruminococcaceae bacterium]|nr:DUF3021 domain-containing protein [Oscillospiraceae bacterium]